MSSNSLQRLTEKKGKQLSKILGINSGPSTEVIADMQARINNPLFKLSIADYEAMCGNKMMVKMMSKVIGCDVKQLKKFCKYINVFAENIESSPKSIKKKIIESKKLMRGNLSVLPEDMLEQIVNKYRTIFKIKYVLKDWIPLDKLNNNELSRNPNAIDLLKEHREKISWSNLCLNPSEEAIDLLKANPKNINWNFLSQNPNAIELLEENFDKIDWVRLCNNSNVKVMGLFKEKIKEENQMYEEELEELNISQKINWIKLSENPNAIELLKANFNKICWSSLSGNPNAIELLKENPDEIYWGYLSSNTNPKAIELLREKIEEEKNMSPRELNIIDDYNNINWLRLSENPSAIELLKKNNEKINWNKLSGNKNPKAIELLKANPTKIDWSMLSMNSNQEAIKLIKEKISNENEMSEKEFAKLKEAEKIDWWVLSLNSNPEAIELLKVNPKKIDWTYLSLNPSIFDAVLY